MSGCLLHQIAREITLLLDNNLHETNIIERQDRRNFENVRTIYNFYSCYNLVLVLHENILVFSQSEAYNFSMYIIIKQKKGFRETAEKCFQTQ